MSEKGMTAAAEILALINSRATSPRKDEIEAIIATVTAAPVARNADAIGRSPLHAEICRVANDYVEAFDIDGDPRVEPLRERLGELAAQLPQRLTPASLWPTLADVGAWAEVAFAYAWEEKDDEGDPVYSADSPALNSALDHLVTAARVLAALDEGDDPLPGTERASIAEAVRMPALSPQHLAYRALRAEVDHYDHKASQGDEPDDDAPFMALLERVSDMEKSIWATPATTLADVLLRAEIADNNENGMMDDLDNPDAYLDDRAMAQLTRAVLDVLGGRHAV